MIAVLTF